LTLGGRNSEAGNEDEDLLADYDGIYKEIMGLSLEDILKRGQKALFASLVAAVETKRATHQEMAILRNLLRDNGMVMGLPDPNDRAADTPTHQADLPEYEDPVYDR
jgi:hypothetical protein